MAHPVLRRVMGGFGPILILLISLLASLYSMSTAMENSQPFGDFYFYLLAINIVGILVLIILIGGNLLKLIRQYRNQATGARLTVKLVFMFVMLVIVPVGVVYYFSLQFIQRGIDSWFDVRIGQAFDSAIELSRTAVTDKKRAYLHQILMVKDRLPLSSQSQVSVDLAHLREKTQASEIALLTSGGRILAMSSVDPNDITPRLPDEWVTRLALERGSYVHFDKAEGEEGEGVIRVTVALSANSILADALFLQAVFPVSDRLDELSGRIEDAYTHYKRLNLLHEPLKFSFVLTLSLVLMLSVLSAIWVAFYFARRLVAPIRMLAIGTRVVASGDYDKRLPRYGNDEIGYLVDSFNDMTQRIADARDEVAQSHLLAERERAYLRTVLGSLASGVLTLDAERTVTTVNTAASQILSVDLGAYVGRTLHELAEDWPDLEVFVKTIEPCLEGTREDWHNEAVLFGSSGRRVLMCSGSALPEFSDLSGGHVIVFEDVTDLVQAQRDAAWGEVARRLAHEIKNPLTPIQLSAERLRKRYLQTMDPEDAQVLDRATHTIVQQVEVMKELVKAFAEYARTPQLTLIRQDLNTIIHEVCDLYVGEKARVAFEFKLASDLPQVEIDAGRIRQLMHNLIKNAIEACTGDRICVVTIETQYGNDKGVGYIELLVHDNGPGIPEEIFGKVFEPYVTGKRKGSGLGLPIVKKIVEEHGGMIWTKNKSEGGASIMIRLPLDHALGTYSDAGSEANVNQGGA
ncbi:MAG: HAMP domain-containing protein [Gammaproteobacteria bacterium]|nr:HAMP domain-containing protein [Gammaproteobacteria bacterium]